MPGPKGVFRVERRRKHDRSRRDMISHHLHLLILAWEDLVGVLFFAVAFFTVPGFARPVTSSIRFTASDHRIGRMLLGPASEAGVDVHERGPHATGGPEKLQRGQVGWLFSGSTRDDLTGWVIDVMGPSWPIMA